MSEVKGMDGWMDRRMDGWLVGWLIFKKFIEFFCFEN
jgi:hypothetical protein